jgi:hypothetical protein
VLRRRTFGLEIAHALPDGSFSRDDAVAREAARLSCEHLDGSADLMRHDEDAVHVDGWRLAEWLACSRLWGVPAATLDAELRQRFPAEPPGPGAPQLDEARAAARVQPPFTLAPPCVP